MKKKKIKKWPLVVVFLLICAVFGSLYLFKGYFEKNKEENTPDILEKNDVLDKTYSVTFTLGGNVLINSNLWYDTSSSNGVYEFDPVFTDLNDIMKKSNVNFYFQQSIVGGKDLGLSFNYKYNSPTDVVDALSKLGFNAISLGSYHAYDKGLAGIQNSVKYITEKEIAYSGVNDSEDSKLKNNVITKNGLKIALLSYTTSTDEIVSASYAVNIYSDELVKSDIESIKNDVDVIMVSIDWSNIKNTEVTEEQKRIAKYLSELGVNIVVGNTGYTIQPVEIIDETIVCYSLGNLLSGHSAVDSRISAMVDFNLKITKSNTSTKVNFENINVLLTYAYNSNGTNYKVIPFTKLSTELANYKSYYEKYSNLLTSSNDKIKVYPIGE